MKIERDQLSANSEDTRIFTTSYKRSNNSKYSHSGVFVKFSDPYIFFGPLYFFRTLVFFSDPYTGIEPSSLSAPPSLQLKVCALCGGRASERTGQ